MVRRALILIWAGLLAAAAPASATQDGWPALYDVAGVAADDVLNVRRDPDASSKIVGTLAPDARGIEVVRPNDRHTWGLINIGETSGWVSLAFLERSAAFFDGQFPPFTQCFGTEPFWNLARDGEMLSLKRIDTDTDQTFSIDWEGGTISHRGRHSFRAGDLVAVISGQSCSDGMSDRDYGLEINLILLSEERHYYGCCSIQPPAE